MNYLLKCVKCNEFFDPTGLKIIYPSLFNENNCAYFVCKQHQNITFICDQPQNTIKNKIEQLKNLINGKIYLLKKDELNKYVTEPIKSGSPQECGFIVGKLYGYERVLELIDEIKNERD